MPGGRPSELTATHLDCVCNCRSPSTAPSLPLMSAPELPTELAGHMATLRGECDAHAKARAVAAISPGKARLAAILCASYLVPRFSCSLLGWAPRAISTHKRQLFWFADQAMWQRRTLRSNFWKAKFKLFSKLYVRAQKNFFGGPAHGLPMACPGLPPPDTPPAGGELRWERPRARARPSRSPLGTFPMRSHRFGPSCNLFHIP